MAKGLTRNKAAEILHHGSVRGHPITPKQRGLFGSIKSGKSRKFKRMGRR